jgi:hypothetical protein
MIAFDTTALSILFLPGAKVCRVGSATPIKLAAERMEALVRKISSERDTIIIPAPALSELLVQVPSDKIADLLVQLDTSRWFRVEAFDAAAAVELATRTAAALAAKEKREGLEVTPWQKIKFDRQIVAIAIVSGATELISDDPDVDHIGKRWGIRVSSVADLPIPPEYEPPPLLKHLEDEEEQVGKLEGADPGPGVQSPSPE